ncbi:acyl-CoA dehydrogenase [Ferrovibrio sp.]|uniref:acyl-CoA dehydrogenase n=1 Tax=Ferrovibrio sp. TaxID=1917215 RepID=UPI003517ACEC
MAAENSLSTVNRRDLDFQLFEHLDIGSLTEAPHFADHDRGTMAAVLDTAQAIAAEHFQTHNRKADLNEPHFDGQTVHIIPEVRAALDRFVEAGFMAAHRSYDEGGQQLPWAVLQAAFTCFNAANIGSIGYAFLTIGAANMIGAFGSPEQKARFMQPMFEGRFFGTMCLSEPQAGSGLADIRTKAAPVSNAAEAGIEGSLGAAYRISGSKMWISAGEHELTENIVHMVLARIEGAPAGVKGISLFIVPKRRVEADGSLGSRNDVQLMGLNHKMGFRGTANTLLSFGENGDCIGYLVGEPHRGLDYMFHMMNEARIGVGLGATSLGLAGYLYSLDYAKQRPQGRAPDNKDPASKPVPIIQHADIRRLLLAQKAAVEGALALCLYAASLVDRIHTAADDGEKARLSLLLDMLTPMVKSWPSEFCLEANKHAIQVLGGYGYTRDYPVEQYYRDNRLNPIHEGTHGIQGIDLLGRKMVMKGGAGAKLLFETIAADIAAARALPDCAAWAEELDGALARMAATTRAMLPAAQDGRASLYLANATLYLDAMGHLVIAWMWLRQAGTAARALSGAEGDDVAFYRGKLAAARYFYAYELGRLDHWLPLLARLEPATLEMQADWF